VMMGMRRESAAALESNSESVEKAQPEATLEAKESLRHQWRKRRQHPSKVMGPPTQGVFDKLSIPLGFEGKTFRELFNYLLNRYGTVAIGLYRYRTPSKITLFILLLSDLSLLLSSLRSNLWEIEMPRALDPQVTSPSSLSSPPSSPPLTKSSSLSRGRVLSSEQSLGRCRRVPSSLITYSVLFLRLIRVRVTCDNRQVFDPSFLPQE
jgi:hypothetical protein